MSEGNNTISAKIPFQAYTELLHEAQNKDVSLNQLFLPRIFPLAPEAVKMLAMVIVFKATWTNYCRKTLLRANSI
jgi:hypothetical protein